MAAAVLVVVRGDGVGAAICVVVEGGTADVAGVLSVGGVGALDDLLALGPLVLSQAVVASSRVSDQTATRPPITCRG
jgi:purine-nucleoside phosphorylase